MRTLEHIPDDRLDSYLRKTKQVLWRFERVIPIKFTKRMKYIMALLALLRMILLVERLRRDA